MNRFNVWIIAGLSSLVVVVSSQGWGNLGHRAVATVAWYELNTKAQQAVTAICAGDDDVFGTNPDGLKGLVRCATWPDYIREEYRKDDGDGPDAPLHIFEDIDVVSASDADGLHYADFERRGRISQPNGQSAISAIRECMEALKNPSATARQKAEALAYLTHCTGDIHQPLHAGSVKDLGGNNITGLRVVEKIDAAGHKTYVKVKPKKLHSVWDSYLFVSRGYGDSDAAKFYNDVLKGMVNGLKDEAKGKTTAKEWATVSNELATKFAYRDERNQRIEDDDDLSPDYIKRGQPVADRQVVLAGLRLAAMLNDALGN